MSVCLNAAMLGHAKVLARQIQIIDASGYYIIFTVNGRNNKKLAMSILKAQMFIDIYVVYHYFNEYPMFLIQSATTAVTIRQTPTCMLSFYRFTHKLMHIPKNLSC